MKKILQVCNTDFYLKKFLKPLIKELLENNYQVHTACNTTKNYQAIEDSRVSHHNVSFPSSPNPFAFIKSIRQLIKIIKQNNYDCVNSHNRNASIAARIAAWWCKVPFNVYTAHGFYFHDDQSKLTRWATIQLERGLAKLTTHTLSQSQEDVDLMVNKGYIKANDITWIGNGIDALKFQPCKNKNELRKRLDLPQDKFIICTVGRLVEGKGFQDLIQAFAMLIKEKPMSYLVMIGGNIEQDISPFQHEIKKLITDNNLRNNITLTGMIDNVEDFLSCSDLYVLPSYREGISRSMLEAMSCRLPVLVTNIRGCREVIQDKLKQSLFTPKNVDSLLKYLMDFKSETSKEQTIQAYKLIQEVYNEGAYINRQVMSLNQITRNSHVL